MIAAKAGARPAAADYGMSQEQFASVMSGGYSASGNEGQPQYAGGQDGTACNAAQNADSSVAQYGAAGSQGKMVRCRVTGQKAACRLAVWMPAMKHTLRPWAQRRMLRRKLRLRAERWFLRRQRQQRIGCARMHRQQGQSAPAMGQTAAFAAGTNGTASAGGRNAGGQSKYGKGKFNREGRGDYRRGVKKSDNPDVLYGRDFDEEAIPIEEIIGEMGEVVIRGKIIAMDQREIRNERTILIF